MEIMYWRLAGSLENPAQECLSTLHHIWTSIYISFSPVDHCAIQSTQYKLENIGSRINMRTHAGCTWYPCDLDILTSGSVHAEVLPWTICLPTLVLIAQTVFLLERGQTDRQTQLNALPHAGGYTDGVGKYVRGIACCISPPHTQTG